MPPVPFKVVLEYLERRGWVLLRIKKPWRVFVRGNDESPILIKVDKDGNVDGDEFNSIKPLA